ncbi:hypothetical protein Tco_0426841, partial [Tanacetum coccineum]
MLVDMPGAPETDDTELSRRMTEFTTRVRQNTRRDIYEVVAQHAVITELLAVDRRRQAVITEMLTADNRRQKQFI